jgi:hypothetical protein
MIFTLRMTRTSIKLLYSYLRLILHRSILHFTLHGLTCLSDMGQQTCFEEASQACVY